MNISSGSASDLVGGYPSLSFGLFCVEGSKAANGDSIVAVGAELGFDDGSFTFWLMARAKNELVKSAVTKATLLIRRDRMSRTVLAPILANTPLNLGRRDEFGRHSSAASVRER